MFGLERPQPAKFLYVFLYVDWIQGVGMAENQLTDADVRAAKWTDAGDEHGKVRNTRSDGGGLRLRLLKPSSRNPKGVKLWEYTFSLKVDGEWRALVMGLGTHGEPYSDDDGQTRPFGLAAARKARDAARALVARGIDPRIARTVEQQTQADALKARATEYEARKTVEQAVGEWLKLSGVAKRKDGGEYVKGQFERHVFPVIGAEPLATLTRRQFVTIIDALTASGRGRTANVVLALFRQFVRWAAVRDWIDRDPTLGLTKDNAGGREAPGQRALSMAEIGELRDKLSALPARLQSAVWLLLATGARVGELATARRDAFDLDAKTWLLPETKNGESHLIHLSSFAVRMVRSLARDCDHLLPGRDGGHIDTKTITKAVADRQRTKQLKGRSKASQALILSKGPWTPHDLRRTMASRMRDTCKADRDVIERCLNHKPERLVGTYQVSELMEERRAAFDAWGAKLDEIFPLMRVA